MAGGPRHGTGLFASVVHAVTVVFTVGAAFIVGCLISIWSDPGGWLHQYGLAVTMFVGGIALALVGLFRKNSK